jgi:hypothetical protein
MFHGVAGFEQMPFFSLIGRFIHGGESLSVAGAGFDGFGLTERLGGIDGLLFGVGARG